MSHLRSSLTLFFAVAVAVALSAGTARAQDVPIDDGGADAQDVPPPDSSLTPSSAAAAAPQDAEPATPPADETQLLGDEQALYEEEVGAEDQYGGAHPHEEADKNYFFLGGFYRHHFVPASIVELFVAESPSENFPQFGGEFIRRKNNFDIIASVYYADLSFHGPFLADGDPATDIEWLDSDMWAVMGSATFLWGSHFSDWFAIQYGFGVGVGALFGDMVRTEAYPTANGHARCVPPAGIGQPGSEDPNHPFAGGFGETTEQYCAAPSSTTDTTDPDGSDGEHYGVDARRWLDGGSVPGAWFRLAPQISLRIKPMHQLVFRIDGGFDFFSGIFVGGAAAFGF